MVTREKNVSRVSRNRTPQQSQSQSRLKSFLVNPKQSFMEWFDNYFLHQSRQFYLLVMLILFILGLGLVAVFSASHVSSIKNYGNPFYDFGMQLFFAIVGLFGMVFVSNRSREQIERFGRMLFLLSIVGQFLVMVPGIGKSSGGNSNWISIGPITVQPSEFLKLGMIIYLASALAPFIDRMHDFDRGPKQFIGVGVSCAALVVITGKDMGTAIVIVLVLIALLYLLGLPKNYLAIISGIIAVVGFALITTNDSRKARFGSFIARLIDPSHVALDGSGWQTQHGFWGLAFGGLTGNGLGQSKLDWGWIPEIQNDFIFANIGEELGMLGALVVILLFFLLGRYLLRIANSSGDPFTHIVTLGIMLWIVIQAYINIAVVLGLGPVLGVPLPLISKGGSSLVAVLLALGVVLSFERNSTSPVSRTRRR
jgi:cell division protein FtsW